MVGSCLLNNKRRFTAPLLNIQCPLTFLTLALGYVDGDTYAICIPPHSRNMPPDGLIYLDNEYRGTVSFGQLGVRLCPGRACYRTKILSLN